VAEGLVGGIERLIKSDRNLIKVTECLGRNCEEIAWDIDSLIKIPVSLIKVANQLIGGIEGVV
jgi:hypothetical protein